MVTSVAVLQGPGDVGVGLVGDLHAVVVELVAGVAGAGPEDVLEGGETQGGGQQGGDAQPPVISGEDVVSTGPQSPDKRVEHSHWSRSFEILCSDWWLKAQVEKWLQLLLECKRELTLAPKSAPLCLTLATSAD